MAHRNRKLVTGIALASTLIGAGALVLRTNTHAEVHGVEHLANQVWIERLPTSARDIIGHIVFVDGREERFGVVGRSSQFRHLLELFGWRREQDRLTLFFPQQQSRLALQARTWKCKGEAPAPFELCLELTTQRGQIKFYSLEEWVVDPHAVQESLGELTAETPELAGISIPIAIETPSLAGEWSDVAELPLVR